MRVSSLVQDVVIQDMPILRSGTVMHVVLIHVVDVLLGNVVHVFKLWLGVIFVVVVSPKGGPKLMGHRWRVGACLPLFGILDFCW